MNEKLWTNVILNELSVNEWMPCLWVDEKPEWGGEWARQETVHTAEQAVPNPAARQTELSNYGYMRDWGKRFVKDASEITIDSLTYW